MTHQIVRFKYCPFVCSFLALSKSLEVGLSSSQVLQYNDLCTEMLSVEILVSVGFMVDRPSLHSKPSAVTPCW